MKRRASISSDQLMARMRRQADHTAARKRILMMPRKRRTLQASQQEEGTTGPVEVPIRLVLHQLRQSEAPSLVYRSPLASAQEYARDHHGRLLARYLALRADQALWPFQRDAVEFMKQREADSAQIGCSGGALCDEMGLGKSRDTLTLVLEQNQREASEAGDRYAAGTTLVVCHRILIKNWVRELQQFPRDAFEYGVLLTGCTEPAAAVAHCDVVLTTYATVAAAHKRLADDPLRRVLFGTHWRRIVADEAHAFVSLNTERAMAMLVLQAQSKWALSGTPVQNHGKDLVTLLLFLGIRGSTPTLQRLKELRRTLMLRRTRASLFLEGACESDVRLPHFRQVTRRIVTVPFATAAERLLYCLYARYGQERASGSLSTGMRVTQIILVLRQLCLCPAIVKSLVVPRALACIGQSVGTGMAGARSEDSESVTLRRAMERWCPHDTSQPLRVSYNEDNFIWESPRCVGDKEQRRHYKRLHAEFARVPGQWALTEEALAFCRLQSLDCNRRLLEHLMQHTLRLDLPSSKEWAALRYVSHAAALGDKVIIYSNYVAALKSLNRWLHQAGHRTVLVTGQTGTQEQNDSLLQEFECRPDIRVLLMTLKLGAEGLNIECANHVLFLDLWWNPFASDQGEKRVQRPGQCKDVFVTYLVMEHSIEQHMLRVAERKRALIKTLLEDDNSGEDEDDGSGGCEDFSEEEALQLFDYSVTIEPTD